MKMLRKNFFSSVLEKFLFFKIFFAFLIIINVSDKITKKISAVSMNSSFYRLESASVSNTAGEKSSANYNLSDTLGQLAAGQFSSTGFVIKAGFQYLRGTTPFKFSISNTQINFGTLLPNTFATGQTTLTVTFGGAGGYQVTAVELGPMRTNNNLNIIPDTQCDGGSNTCTESLAKLWTQTTAYGFGYNISGQDIPNDFINNNYFRPFPDALQNENPVVVMSSNNVGKNRQAVMTFKINISPIQPAGSYQTIINFVATPSF